MNVLQQLKLATSLSGLWHQLMPEIGIPERKQFLLWAGLYKESEAVQGMNRAAKKHMKLQNTSHPMTLDEAVSYAASVMENEKLGRRDFTGNTYTPKEETL
jgi:hypothetical protein